MSTSMCLHRHNRLHGGFILALAVAGAWETHGIALLWQWTDALLATPPSPRSQEGFVHSLTLGRSETRASIPDAEGEPKIYPGRNPIYLGRSAESPYSSISRLRKMAEEYIPFAKREFFDLPMPARKSRLGDWIPALESKLEKKLRAAINDQWAAGVAPLQAKDPHKMPRILQNQDAYLTATEEAEAVADPESHGVGPERLREIDDFERTFGFGYQLLRMCAVEKYEDPFFQQHIEDEFRLRLEKTEAWLERARAAMTRTPEDIERMEANFSRGAVKRARADRDAVLKLHRAGHALENDPVVGVVSAEGTSDAEAVKFIYEKPWPVDEWNKGDESQKTTGDRMPFFTSSRLDHVVVPGQLIVV